MFQHFHMTSYLIISLSILVLLSYGSSGSIQNQKILISDHKSFEVTTNIREYDNQGSLYDYKILEKYSAEQRRAKLEFKLSIKRYETNDEQNSHNYYQNGTLFSQKQQLNFLSGTYLVDNRSNVILYCQTNSCKLTGLDKLQAHVCMQFTSEFHKIAADYIVGPAQLIYLVANYKDRFKLLSEGTKFVRNIPTLEYELTLHKKKSQLNYSAKFLIYFNKLENVPASTKSLPIRIIIHLHESRSITVDFTHFKFFPIDTWTLGSHRAAENGLVALNEFILPPNCGCSDALEQIGVNLFANRLDIEAPKNRFSFEAIIQNESDQNGATNSASSDANEAIGSRYTKLFVAYDESLQSLRVDTYEPNSKIETSRQVINFRLNKQYHILEKGDNVLLNEDTSHCVSTQMPDYEKLNNGLNLAKLITGTEKFVYLGNAKVRGIKAFVYESSNCKLPVWLESPIAYENTSLELNIRWPERPIDNLSGCKRSMTSLFYFASNKEHSLLRIEIVDKCLQSSFVVDEYSHDKSVRHVIDISGFKWTLDSAPNGDHSSEMFSLKDHCSSNVSGQYNRIELQLEHYGGFKRRSLNKTNKTQDEHWILSSKMRQLAVLSGLQETLGLSSQMIHDLETKLSGSVELSEKALNNKEIMHQYLKVSFQKADHVKELIGLVYLGNGQQLESVSNQNQNRISGLSFQNCYLMAAHLNFETYFAYDSKERLCLINKSPIDHTRSNKLINEEPTNFQLKKLGGSKFEIYRTHRTTDFKNSKDGQWIHNRDPYSQQERYQLLDKRLVLDYGGHLEFERFEEIFIIRDVRIESDDLIDNLKSDDNIHGFKFVVGQTGAIWEVKSRVSSYLNNQKSNINRVQELTHEKCETLCMADLNCRSYSICFKKVSDNSNVECSHSKVDLNIPQIKQQLYQKHDLNKEGTWLVKINSDVGDTIEIQRYSGCSLYSKSYLGFFLHKNERVRIRPSKMTTHLVDKIEDCARICFAKNVNLLKSTINEKLKDISVAEPVGRKSVSILDLCLSFKYLTNFEVNNLSKKYGERFLRLLDATESGSIARTKSEDKLAGDYCMLTKEMTNQQSSVGTMDDSQWFLDVQLYNVNYETFFSKMPAVGLTSSLEGNDIMDAYNLVTSKARFEEQQSTGLNVASSNSRLDYAQKILQASLDSGDNFQIESPGNAINCAMLCLTQTINPWPACRSFDLMVKRVGGQNMAICRFNSMSVNDALENNRLDLINHDERMWHFELKWNLFVSLDQTSRNLVVPYRISWSFELLVNLCIVIVGTLTGLTTGFKLREQLRKNSIEVIDMGLELNRI